MVNSLMENFIKKKSLMEHYKKVLHGVCLFISYREYNNWASVKKLIKDGRIKQIYVLFKKIMI